MDTEHYNTNRGIFSPLVEHNGIVCGFWMVGNDYRNKARYYGAYPPGYLKRMKLLFPQEFEKGWTLHLFSGMVPCGERELTFDIKPELEPHYIGNAEEVDSYFLEHGHQVHLKFDLILADPPYGENHLKYGTKPVNKKKVIKSCAKILHDGGHLVWLDTIMPIWAKADGWKLKGTIGLLQSTNHQVRVITILEKLASDQITKKAKRDRYGAVKV